MKKSTIVYKYNDSLYINLTNRCVMACTYCIKYKWKSKFRGHNLRLEKEPSAQEIIKAIKDPGKFEEIIFCGYGEPLVRFAVVKEVALWVKDNDGNTRLNTTGNFKTSDSKDMLSGLRGVIDSISVSLNAPDAETYERINHPKYGAVAFKNVLSFIRLARYYVPDTTITTVALPGIEIAKCRSIAKKLKVKFRLRPYLDGYENS